MTGQRPRPTQQQIDAEYSEVDQQQAELDRQYETLAQQQRELQSDKNLTSQERELQQHKLAAVKSRLDQWQYELTAKEQELDKEQQRIVATKPHRNDEPKECTPGDFVFPPVSEDMSPEERKAWNDFRNAARRSSSYRSRQGQRGMQVDHIIPISRLWNLPGFKKLTLKQKVAIANIPENLKVIPRKWNSNKSSKTPSEWEPPEGIDPEITDKDWKDLCEQESKATKEILKALQDKQAEQAQGSTSEDDSSAGDDSDGGTSSDATDGSEQDGEEQTPVPTVTSVPNRTQPPAPTTVAPTTEAPTTVMPETPATQTPTTTPPEVNPRVPPTTTNTEPSKPPTEAPATTEAPEHEPSFVEKHKGKIAAGLAIGGAALLCIALCAETGGAAALPLIAAI